MKRQAGLFNDHRGFIESAVVLSVFACIGIVSRYAPLDDPDLGWHLAGGLWMLEHVSVPAVDPFGSNGSLWVNYSWLGQVFIAIAYKMRGYEGLWILQAFVLYLFIYNVWLLFDSLSFERDDRRFSRYAKLLCFALGLLFCSPAWYLRPQLLSLVFTAVVLRWAESGNLRLIPLLCLGIVWANVHVYWVLLPLFVAAFFIFDPRYRGELLAGRGLLKPILLAGVGFLSPYGPGNLEAIYRYLFMHSEAYSIIREFAPLSPSVGIFYWLFIGVLVFILLNYRKTAKALSPALILLFILFAVLSLFRIKYLPIFGLLAALVVCQTICCGRNSEKVRIGRACTASGAAWLSGVCGGVFSLAVILFVPIPSLAKEQNWLLLSAKKLSLQASSGGRVLNEFDDGGWLALGFWLYRPQDSLEPNLKTCIDGRTLVMGEARLKEYKQVYAGAKNACEILSKWRFDYSILPEGSVLASRVSQCQPSLSSN